MVTCTKCKKQIPGLRTEKIGYGLLIFSIPSSLYDIYKMGYPTIISIALLILGIALITIFHSKNNFCPDCNPKKCPVCNNTLSPKFYCKNCNATVCPFCDSVQEKKKKSLSWFSAICAFFGGAFLLLVFVFLMFTKFGFLDFIIAILLYLYLGSHKCMNCNNRIYDYLGK